MNKILVSCLALFLGTIGSIAIAGYFLDISTFFKPISVVSKVIIDGELKKTDGKTNILILGTDARTAGSHSNSALTDTVAVVSIDDSTGKTVLISLPRDIWIQEYKTKINSVYALSGRKPESISSAVEKVLGIPVHYHVIVGFDVFQQAVDAVGGIEVEVDHTFDDYQYPIEGRENAEPESSRYEHIHFDAGRQKMNGVIALKFARSRHSSNPVEAGDFARARRQQKVMLALKDKVISAETLFNPLKLSALYDSYKDNVRTNIEPGDVALFYKAYSDFKFDDIERIVISNETPGSVDSEVLGSGMLISPGEADRQLLYNGAYVLVPKSGNFDEIHTLVRTTLFD